MRQQPLSSVIFSEAMRPAKVIDAEHRALATGVHRLKGITSILSTGLDSQPLPEVQLDLLADVEHGNIRGNAYYR